MTKLRLEYAPLEHIAEAVPVRFTDEAVPVRFTAEAVPVRFTAEAVPVRLADEAVAVRFTAEAVSVSGKEVNRTEQLVIGSAWLSGVIGSAKLKSAKLLSVSVQPLFFLS